MLFYDKMKEKLYIVLSLQYICKYDIIEYFRKGRNDIMMKYNGNIADITLMIKHLMLDMDIKQKDLCNGTGWTKATISNLLNNRTENPSLKVLYELCNAMNCDLVIDIVPKKD